MILVTVVRNYLKCSRSPDFVLVEIAYSFWRRDDYQIVAYLSDNFLQLLIQLYIHISFDLYQRSI